MLGRVVILHGLQLGRRQKAPLERACCDERDRWLVGVASYASRRSRQELRSCVRTGACHSENNFAVFGRFAFLSRSLVGVTHCRRELRARWLRNDAPSFASNPNYISGFEQPACRARRLAVY